ncbi:MAG: (d)CMP kinase [Thermomicrobiales bacterium]
MTAHDHRRLIAIDGPAAAGKTTVARLLAEATGAMLFDTGSLYRAVTLAALRREVCLDDGDALGQLAAGLDIRLARPSVDDGRLIDVIVDGDDVTWAIRTPEVDADVSKVSAYPQVRSALLEAHRRIADGVPVVMVGRDIGTVIAPRAGLKIYLDASVEERARRRWAELAGRDAGMTYDDVLQDLRRRDAHDSARDVAPLRAADDAVHVLTDGKSIDSIVAELNALVEQTWAAQGLAS